MVQMTAPKTGEVRLFRVQKMSMGDHKLMLRLHKDTRTETKDKANFMDISSWDKLREHKAQKVTVDPIGRVFPCND
jgi:hypothetical protein